jgi:hypothetical protein
LNQALPNFSYGNIRKIVRRNQLGLNYTYEWFINVFGAHHFGGVYYL